jgi:hypothetical protein
MYRDLIQTAAKAKNKLNDEACESIMEFINSMQNPDGGFRGRNNAESDLYYSVFATLSSLSLTGDVPAGIPDYSLSFKNPKELDLIHLCSLIRLLAACQNTNNGSELLGLIESYRSSDGGYNHISKEATKSTPYGAFLAFSAYNDMEKDIPKSYKLLSSIYRNKTPDGGFSNIPDSGKGTTNATAAALTILPGSLQKFVQKKNADFLLSMAFPKGGFRATKEAPIPDVLSTATALYALRKINYEIPEDLRENTFEMIEDHWNESGGFVGNCGETVADCEYTFYALLAMGSLLS